MSTTTAILLGVLVLLALHLATRASRRRAQASRQEQRRQVAKRLDSAPLSQPTPVCLQRNAASEHRALQRRMVAAKREQDAAALHAARLMLAVAHACRDDQRQP
ncbi:hypothetical protein [Actinomyces capricornis]|uniref:Uncharacterized protein n=1 Tax=Actinomyces capricornis TaxID=2755559 RepID=A0ABN6K7T1_9ACTO|nr:hypothetical protein [Actinomyces capricornis]BDA65717.1 hypothetical protein MANAM107_25510 [Actinomyces capricornis]